jgi:hypothetical protein
MLEMRIQQENEKGKREGAVCVAMTENVNFKSQMKHEVNTSGDVNLMVDSSTKLTLHISKQVRDIFRFYAETDFKQQYQQTEIIKALYGEISPSRKASVNRTVKCLVDLGLMGSAKCFPYAGYRVAMRVRFFVTEKGEQFAMELKQQL